jgi:hypothetical protein
LVEDTYHGEKACDKRQQMMMMMMMMMKKKKKKKTKKKKKIQVVYKLSLQC